jgi:hypothetical protein
VIRLLDGRHHLERSAMEQAGEVDYLVFQLVSARYDRASLIVTSNKAVRPLG